MNLSGFLAFLKPKPESPAEKVALERLDEVTRETAWGEEGKEEEREEAGLGFGPYAARGGHSRAEFHHVPGDPVPEPLDDPDPAGGPSMRDVMHEDEPQH